MTTATIAVGTRVRINGQYGVLPTYPLLDVLADFVALTPVEREDGVGSEGTVTKIDSGSPWPYHIDLDGGPRRSFSQGRIVLAAHEFDVLEGSE